YWPLLRASSKRRPGSRLEFCASSASLQFYRNKPNVFRPLIDCWSPYMYFGNDTSVARLTADGTTSYVNWCILTNGFVTNALNIRGGFYVDQTGVWSNNLVVATSDSGNATDNKGIWRVEWQGTNAHPIFITNILTPHLEGVVTLPNTNSWGPLAGKIITG